MNVRQFAPLWKLFWVVEWRTVVNIIPLLSWGVRFSTYLEQKSLCNSCLLTCIKVDAALYCYVFKSCCTFCQQAELLVLFATHLSTNVINDCHEFCFAKVHCSSSSVVCDSPGFCLKKNLDFYRVTKFRMKVKSYHCSKFSNLRNWKEEALKISGLPRESNLWPPQYWCNVLPTELLSHTSGARSIYWVHIFPCSEMMWSIKWNN